MKKIHIVSWLLSLSLILSMVGCAQKPAEEPPVESQTASLPAQTTVPESTAPETAAAEPTVPETYEIFTPQSAKSVLLYDVENKKILCAYEPDLQLAPGGLAKIVTAVLALENCDLDEEVTNRVVQKFDLSATNISLYRGETLTVRDLTAAMVLRGAADAAMVLADRVAGSQEAFVEMMNQWAADIGCTNTKFANVHGLATEPSYTTARDLLKILGAALENETFRELFGTKYYEIPATDRSEVRQLYTSNYMMDQNIIPDFYDERITGGMQSYVEAVGGNLICTVRDGGSYIAIVLGAERVFAENGWHVRHYGNFDEMTALLEQGLAN